MTIEDIVESPERLSIFDTILEEACRQWCDMIDEAPERREGEGFARFFYEIFADKEQEYLKEQAAFTESGVHVDE